MRKCWLKLIIGDEYNGFWNRWYEQCVEMVNRAKRRLIKYQIEHMDEYDSKVGERIISSLRLKEDGTVDVRFWGNSGCKKVKIVIFANPIRFMLRKC